MQCHEPGHRASARCVSALLAVGVLLTIVTHYSGRTSERPAIKTVALGLPPAPSAASVSAALAQRSERLAAYALTRTQFRPPLSDEDASGSPAWRSPTPDDQNASGSPARPSRELADSRQAGRYTRRAGHARRLAGTPGEHQSVDKGSLKPAYESSAAWQGHSVADRDAEAYLVTHLPAAKSRKASAAVHEALRLIGVPYRWGGTTRAGFDCSGFTQHVWAAAGVAIPRTVRAQAEAGTRVPLNKAEPGDLVVFYSTQHHVGLYIGNGLVIHSPHTGTTVRPDPVRSMPVAEVVRVHD
jgi:peptidoglycan DL-endopeptidase CwlO